MAPWFRRRLIWLLPAVVLAVALWIPNAAPRPAPLERSESAGGHRFGLTHPQRRAFFRELAEADARWRTTAEGAFPGDEWAQADHWTDLLSQRVREMAKRLHVSIVQVLLAWDEGLHEGWRGPGQKRLRTTWPPLSKRAR